MKRRYAALFAALALAALLLTACGKASDEATGAETPAHTVFTPPPDDPEGLPGE